jgi:hypothetical protein
LRIRADREAKWPSPTDVVGPLEQETAVKADPWSRLRDFSGALLRGETFAALEAARDAYIAAPNTAEAHYAFGRAWSARDKPERAEQAFSSLQNCDRERPSP